MDDNTKEVLILLITTISTISIAWLRVRSVTHARQPEPVPPPAQPAHQVPQQAPQQPTVVAPEGTLPPELDEADPDAGV